ncbi:MAG: AraC family transcriptional regulator [Verrucomicrobia bacterium]|jgi:AraC-like DNA-binding protein|nr:AraC family transcriptional regulator [Verrucomicrobiota bacterium]
MENPIKRQVPLKTEFLVSCYNTPSETVRRLFYVVVRAGHLRSAPDYRIERDHLPGHDLLLCLSGSGFVLSNNRRFKVESSELAWISGYHPHAHWANPADPWELLWIRIDGRAIEEACNILSVLRFPVFSKIPIDSLRREFRRILRLMIRRPLVLDALLNAAVSEILAMLFENRQAEPLESFGGLPEIAADVREAFTKMALYPDRPWRVAELAQFCGLSEPHFYRKFKQATGSTPIDWLRRERINHARRRLLESNDPIKQVAEQVGYNDAFFFSRDFKRYTGVAPKNYRSQHMREV